MDNPFVMRLSMTGFICAYPQRLTNMRENMIMLFFIRLPLWSLEIFFVVDGKFANVPESFASLQNLTFHFLVVKMLIVNLLLGC